MHSTKNSADTVNKTRNAKRIFTIVAPKYQIITRILSFGRDQYWKKKLLELLPNHTAPVIVDLATGSGDIAFALKKKYPSAKVIGMDINHAMMSTALKKNKESSIYFSLQDMNELSLKSNTAAMVTGGYALRNAPDLQKTLREIHRILQTDGTAAFLDFSKPHNKFLQHIEFGLLMFWGTIISLIFHRRLSVYTYIPHSLKAFPDRKQLKTMLSHAGFSLISSRLYFWGVVEIIVCKKC